MISVIIKLSMRFAHERQGGDTINGFRVMRLRRGLTQVEAAKALGVAQCTVSVWEAGRVYPTAKDLLRVAKFYRCTVEELMAEYEQRIVPAHKTRSRETVQGQRSDA